MVKQDVILVKLLNEVLDTRKKESFGTDEDILKILIQNHPELITKQYISILPKIDRALKMRRENKKTSKKQIIELILNEPENK